MFKNFRDKIALSGITVLMIGVALLIGTFLSAYAFLTQSLSIIASEDLVKTFGEALAPLIATCIRIMYLGVMGWIGSLLTIRGVTIIAHTPQKPTVVPQTPTPPQQKPSPQKAKAEKPQKEAKPEAKPSEPEFVVIPPEQVSQPQPEPKEPQKNDSSPQPSNH
jgi:hypothetical protein